MTAIYFDNLTESGATKLAWTITEYWRKHNYHGIETRIEMKAHRGGPMYVVRSNMTRGYPPPKEKE